MRSAVVCLAAVALYAVTPASAGLFEEIYRGLDLLATPSGGPLIGSPDGTRSNGQRSGRLRIVPDRVGRGYTLEFDRSFGVDSRGRPEVLDLGVYELELSGASQGTFGFTKRGMLIGNATFQTNNVNYALRGKTGAQDFVLTGTGQVSSAFEINQLGFYTVNFDFSNTNSQLEVDGLLVDGENDTDFDIGPINVEGNIFVDAFVGLLGAVGVDTTGLEQVFPDSPIDLLTDSIREQLRLPEAVAGSQYTNVDPLTLNSSAAALDAAQTGDLTLVPEPAAVMLLALGAVLLRRRG